MSLPYSIFLLDTRKKPHDRVRHLEFLRLTIQRTRKHRLIEKSLVGNAFLKTDYPRKGARNRFSSKMHRADEESGEGKVRK
jgi:hypothetical protein